MTPSALEKSGVVPFEEGRPIATRGSPDELNELQRSGRRVDDEVASQPPARVAEGVDDTAWDTNGAAGAGGSPFVPEPVLDLALEHVEHLLVLVVEQTRCMPLLLNRWCSTASTASVA
jgi:hypothetical protein